MEDYLSLLPATLQWISSRLGAVSPIPWPLWIGGLFPLYVAVVSVIIWILRGQTWPVRCSYPKTKRNRPCLVWVPGEWFRCRHHNRRAYYHYGHDVNPTVRRWQTFGKSGEIIERTESGVGVLRLRPVGSTLLYERGYVRPPIDVLRNVMPFARRTWQRLRQMRLRRRDPASAATVAPDPTRSDIATGLVDVVQATRFASIAFGAGLVLTAVAVLVSGDVQTVLQYVATLGFVLAWAAISSGAYQRAQTWLRGACLKTLEWWVVIFVPVGVLNLFFTVVNTPARG